MNGGICFISVPSSCSILYLDNIEIQTHQKSTESSSEIQIHIQQKYLQIEAILIGYQVHC